MHHSEPRDKVAVRVDRLATPLRLLLTGAVAGTVGAALWLFWVAAVVLPTRDPQHVAMWRLVAIGYAVVAGGFSRWRPAR